MQHLEESTTAWRGALFSVEVLRLRDENGDQVRREVVRHPGAVAVVAALPAADGGSPRIVLIRNHRVAVDERLWEVPAGKLEPGEAPQRAAARELQEETGYRAGVVRPLGRFYTSPGFADEIMHVFAAESLVAGEPSPEPGEDIAVQTVDLEAIHEMVTSGVIRDGKTIAALSLWERQQ